MSGNKPMSDLTTNKVRISGYIALVLAIIFFSGLLKDAESFLKFFDFTNVLGSFGKLGTISDDAGKLASNFRGTGGTGVRDGWLFALTLTPAVMLALGVVKIVEDLDGLKAAQKLMTPLLRPLMGIPGICGLALVASLQSTDTGGAMTKELYDNGSINDKERLIFCSFQLTAGALLTNYLSSGAALFAFLDVPILVPLIVVIVFKLISTNIVRIYANHMIKEEV
jgi:nucleoside recognition membrane protein YjiH